MDEDSNRLTTNQKSSVVDHSNNQAAERGTALNTAWKLLTATEREHQTEEEPPDR